MKAKHRLCTSFDTSMKWHGPNSNLNCVNTIGFEIKISVIQSCHWKLCLLDFQPGKIKTGMRNSVKDQKELHKINSCLQYMFLFIVWYQD